MIATRFVSVVFSLFDGNRTMANAFFSRVRDRMTQNNEFISLFDQMAVDSHPILQDHIMVSEFGFVLKGLDYHEQQGANDRNPLVEFKFLEVVELE